MKNQRRPEAKLVLRPQVIRTLDQLDLHKIAGGDPASALCPTHRFCTLAC